MVMYNKAWVHVYIMSHSPVTLLNAVLVNVQGDI